MHTVTKLKERVSRRKRYWYIEPDCDGGDNWGLYVKASSQEEASKAFIAAWRERSGPKLWWRYHRLHFTESSSAEVRGYFVAEGA